MEIPLLLKALILGIVEGLTEFLPISSTGHLIIVGQLLEFNDDKGKIFEIVIQTGAMLAIVWEYRRKFAGIIMGLPNDARARQFVINLAIAFMPAAVLGLAFGKHIKAALFKPVPVAMAFIVGALMTAVVAKPAAGGGGAWREIPQPQSSAERPTPPVTHAHSGHAPPSDFEQFVE